MKKFFFSVVLAGMTVAMTVATAVAYTNPGG